MKDQFENVVIKGVHASRYIASWLRAGGGSKFFESFDEWLKSLGLTEDERATIRYLAATGRLELEMSAKAYLKKVQTSK